MLSFLQNFSRVYGNIRAIFATASRLSPGRHAAGGDRRDERRQLASAQSLGENDRRTTRGKNQPETKLRPSGRKRDTEVWWCALRLFTFYFSLLFCWFLCTLTLKKDWEQPLKKSCLLHSFFPIDLVQTTAVTWIIWSSFRLSIRTLLCRNSDRVVCRSSRCAGWLSTCWSGLCLLTSRSQMTKKQATSLFVNH